MPLAASSATFDSGVACACRRGNCFDAVAVDQISFNEFDLRDNVGLLVLLQLKTQQQQQQQHVQQQYGSGQQHLRFADDGSCLNSAGNGTSSNGAAVAAHASPFIGVANTHVLFNPRRGDIKVAQLRLLIKHLQGLVAAHLPPQQQQQVLGLVMGDLNHQPNTAVYRFMAQGWVDCLRQHRKNMAGR
jgi:mRNA deadenylase 3'-5' endonuclease subunit Ccr4